MIDKQGADTGDSGEEPTLWLSKLSLLHTQSHCFIELVVESSRRSSRLMVGKNVLLES